MRAEWWKAMAVVAVLLIVCGADLATYHENGREAVGFGMAAAVAWQWKRCAAKGIAAVHKAKSDLVDEIYGREVDEEQRDDEGGVSSALEGAAVGTAGGEGVRGPQPLTASADGGV